MIEKTKIVEIARTFLKTPFHHQGRAPGKGLDCIGTIACSITGAGGVVNDCINYRRRGNGEVLMKYLDENLTAIELEEIGPSSVLVFVDEKTQRPGHIALFTGKGTIIHAILNDQVVEEELGDYWRGRLLCAYNIPGAE